MRGSGLGYFYRIRLTALAACITYYYIISVNLGHGLCYGILTYRYTRPRLGICIISVIGKVCQCQICLFCG